MKIERIFLNRLQMPALGSEAVVVIDVLRSFTTAAVALARGASAIYPVEGVSAAANLAARLPRSLAVGAIAGGDPVDGFDFGNSPSALARASVRHRAIVLSTAAGVRGLQRFYEAPHLFAASLVCAQATAAAIRRLEPARVTMVVTGEWVDRDGDEDVACADYIEALLLGRRVDPAVYGERVRCSDFGRRFLANDAPHLPLADLEIAADVDRYDFAMPVLRCDGRLKICR